MSPPFSSRIAAPETRRRAWLDRLGITASMACALHCALTPVLLALAPSLGLAAWNERWEPALLAFVTVLALCTMGWGSHCHRRFEAWGLLLPGLVLAWVAHLALGEGHLHRTGLVLGGLLVAAAHVWNQRLTHRPRPCTGCTPRTPLG